MEDSKITYFKIGSPQFEETIHLIHRMGMSNNPRMICLKHFVNYANNMNI